MRLNIGRADRIIRLLVAAAVLIAWYQKMITGTAGVILLVIAGVFVLTSLLGSCPLYTLFGINTCSRKKVV